MSLYVYRSQRVEELARMLGTRLSDSWPTDPFERVSVVVGSRGMERWLKYRLATQLGGLAGVDFLFPGPAFDAGIRSVIEPSAQPFGEPEPDSADEWKGGSLTMRVLRAIRERVSESDFAQVKRYLGRTDGPVGARELGFAVQVTRTVGQLLGDRPDDVLGWLDESRKPEAQHAWVATLLVDLHANARPSSAQLLAKLEACAPSDTGKSLVVFGLSTLSMGDKRRLAALANHIDLHVFALAPSAQWWADIHSLGEVRSALLATHDEQDRNALLAEFDRQNAVLSANGRPSRDLQLWIEELNYNEFAAPHESRPEMDPELGEESIPILVRLQRWIDDAADNPQPGAAPWVEDRSIEVHACHGALRQCEALRDELLRRFAEDSTLDPREVLVMTLDVATYAPLIAAVFARTESTPPIPVHIADLGLRSTNSVADALLQTLNLAQERVTATRLLEVLALGPVRARLGLSEDDLAEVRAMVAESGIRWAWDAADRERHEQPALDQNTVRFGLERLALGTMMPTLEALGVVPAHGDGIGPALPLELTTRDRVERFGMLAELCMNLQELCDRMREPATTAEWRARFRDLLETLTRVEGAEAGLRAQVDRGLGDLLPAVGDDGPMLDLSAVTSLLTDAFELPQKGDRAITGAVTVCAMEPMRSVPFRVIAVLGLDDGAFPRGSRAPSWDPFAKPRHGEYDRRMADRHLFLETILCARDALLLFGTGFGPKRGEHVPLSVVVSELCEVVAAGVGKSADSVVIEHPLQPWSATAFANEQRLPFDSLWARARAAMRKPTNVGLGATREDVVLPREAELAKKTPGQLARALVNPAKELLQDRLSLNLDVRDARPLDREPLEENTLDEHRVRSVVLNAFQQDAHADRDGLEARLRAEGTLPLSSAGQRSLDLRIDEARRSFSRARDLGGELIALDPLGWKADGLTLNAAVQDARRVDDALVFVWTTASKTANESLQLEAWLTMLLARAQDLEVERSYLVGYEGTIELTALTRPLAIEHLQTIIALYREARSGPIPLFPKLSRALVDSRDVDQSAARRIIAQKSAWEPGGKTRAALDDPWVHALYGDLTIEDLAARADDVLQKAEVLWAPLLANLSTSSSLGPMESA
jgi:exodeoxyribonuclease V gamma subunit